MRAHRSLSTSVFVCCCSELFNAGCVRINAIGMGTTRLIIKVNQKAAGGASEAGVRVLGRSSSQPFFFALCGIPAIFDERSFLSPYSSFCNLTRSCDAFSRAAFFFLVCAAAECTSTAEEAPPKTNAVTFSLKSRVLSWRGDRRWMTKHRSVFFFFKCSLVGRAAPPSSTS
jgi:hypothetical protein